MNKPIFSKPELNSYEFMRLLCASFIKNNKIIVDATNITERVYKFKNEKCDSKSLYIFNDIEFRKGTNYVVSNGISGGLDALQTFGVIGKFNPTYARIIIYLTLEEADEILKSYPKEKKIMLSLAKYVTE
jgi:hypothetical protein